MARSTDFWGRETSDPAGNGNINFSEQDEYFFFYFETYDPDGDGPLEGDLELTADDDNTIIWIWNPDLNDGEGGYQSYSVSLEVAGVLPEVSDDPNTPENEYLADSGDKVPTPFEGKVVYKIIVHDYYGEGDDLKIVFAPDGSMDQEDWASFKNGAIDLGKEEPTAFVCFQRGSLIDTPQGPMAVENLSAGDLVLIDDDQPAAIKWAGSTSISMAELMARPDARPICIPAGALGNAAPTTDLWVSPQHRMLIQGHLAETLFGASEVLVAAKHLDFGDLAKGKKRPSEVEYFHILLEKHDVLIANGAPAESLFLGDQALTMLSDDSLREIEAKFPRDDHPEMWEGEIAAPTLTAREARVLSDALRRERDNQKANPAAA